MKELPAKLPATFKNTDPEWVDAESGLTATPNGLIFIRTRRADTLHVMKRDSDIRTLCGTGGAGYTPDDMADYLGRPADFEKTWTVCGKCRKAWAAGER